MQRQYHAEVCLRLPRTRLLFNIMIISRSITDGRWRRQGLGRGVQDNVYDIIYTYTCIIYVIHCTRIPRALDHLRARQFYDCNYTQHYTVRPTPITCRQPPRTQNDPFFDPIGKEGYICVYLRLGRMVHRWYCYIYYNIRLRWVPILFSCNECQRSPPSDNYRTYYYYFCRHANAVPYIYYII